MFVVIFCILLRFGDLKICKLLRFVGSKVAFYCVLIRLYCIFAFDNAKYYG
jgi:hypothetical protein